VIARREETVGHTVALRVFNAEARKMNERAGHGIHNPLERLLHWITEVLSAQRDDRNRVDLISETNRSVDNRRIVSLIALIVASHRNLRRYIEFLEPDERNV
jgi:hypothetical protein